MQVKVKFDHKTALLRVGDEQTRFAENDFPLTLHITDGEALDSSKLKLPLIAVVLCHRPQDSLDGLAIN